MRHKLNIWPQYFEAVCSNRKTFEVRVDDRIFNEGDELELHEWEPELKIYTGRMIARNVGYILRGPAFGIEAGYVVMALR